MKWQRVVHFIGRLLLAAIFLWSGFGKIVGWQGTAGYMASKGLPLVPVLLVVALLVELGGGLALLLNFWTRWAALALTVFLVPVTLIFHAFWAVPAEEQQIQMVMFFKNLAIMGGLLNLATPPMEPSSDRHEDSQATAH